MTAKGSAKGTSKSASKSDGTKSGVPAAMATEIEEALALFDATGGSPDRVDVKDLKVILRALGFEPRKEDIKQMSEELQPDENGAQKCNQASYYV